MTKKEMVEELVNDLHLLFSERLIDSLRENNDVIGKVDNIDDYIEAENEALRIFAQDLIKLYK
jgi:hypothetical protein